VHRVSISLRIVSQISKHEVAQSENPGGYTRADALKI
jgi:hypothetical protein